MRGHRSEGLIVCPHQRRRAGIRRSPVARRRRKARSAKKRQREGAMQGRAQGPFVFGVLQVFNANRDGEGDATQQVTQQRKAQAGPTGKIKAKRSKKNQTTTKQPNPSQPCNHERAATKATPQAVIPIHSFHEGPRTVTSRCNCRRGNSSMVSTGGGEGRRGGGGGIRRLGSKTAKLGGGKTAQGNRSTSCTITSPKET